MNEDLPKFRSRFGVLFALFIVGFAGFGIATGLATGGFWGAVFVVMCGFMAMFGAAGFAVELSRPKEDKTDE